MSPQEATALIQAVTALIGAIGVIVGLLIHRKMDTLPTKLETASNQAELKASVSAAADCPPEPAKP